MATQLTEPHDTSMKRVALASFVGSAIEYYDFYIYGTAAALVFPKVFFPHLGTTMATVASMATFAAAFLTRPLGATLGDFFDKPPAQGGLGLSRPLASAVLALFVLACVLILPQRPAEAAAPGRRPH